MSEQQNKGIEDTSPLTMEDWEKEFVEKGAELEHIRWAKWQNYLHTFLVWNNDIQMWTLPHEKKEWWDSEIRTPYSMLTEKQKESDRKEVRQYIPLIRLLLSSAVSQALKEERQFIFNILDGIDKADHEMLNSGGGTKTIRQALESRIIK